MSLSLAYDSVLSRVRISGSALSIVDAFGRTVANGWGTSESGQVWTTSGGTASEYSTNGTRGLISLASVSASRNVVTGTGIGDVDVTVSMSIVVLAAGGYIAAGPVARWSVSGSDFYFLRCEFNPGGSITLNLFRVAGGSVSLASTTAAVTHSTGTTYTARMKVTAGRIQCKFWQTSQSEPAAWDIDMVDSTPLAAGAVGVRAQLQSSNTNTLPVVPQFDNFSAVPTVKVERSTDQVRWTTVRGGTALTPTSGAISLDDYEFTPDVVSYYRVLDQSANITPTLGGVWLKSLARPFLNRQVIVQDYSDVDRSSRGGVFEVVGRTMPIAVSDVRGSRRWTLDVLTNTSGEAGDLDLMLASGDVLMVHVPANSGVPAGYVSVGDTRQARTSRTSVRRITSMPCTEVAAPGPDVVGATANCQTVLNTYATCADVLAAHPTCASLLQLIGSPTDVIVP